MPGSRFCALMPGIAAACPKLHTVNIETEGVFEWPATTEIEAALAEAAAIALGDRLLTFTLLGSRMGTTYDGALTALARCCPNLRALTVCAPVNDCRQPGYVASDHERGGITVPALLTLAAACPHLTHLDLRETPGESLGDAYLADALTENDLDQLGRCLPHLVSLRLPWSYTWYQPFDPWRRSFRPQRPGARLKGVSALARRCPHLELLEIGYEAMDPERDLREAKRRAADARRRFRGVVGSAMGMRRALGRAVDRLFAPGGAGYESARQEFTDLATTSARAVSAEENDGAA